MDVGSVDVFDKSETDSKYQRRSVEVDFVVNHMSHRYYIQVALDISSTTKKAQEVRSLLDSVLPCIASLNRCGCELRR